MRQTSADVANGESLLLTRKSDHGGLLRVHVVTRNHVTPPCGELMLGRCAPTAHLLVLRLGPHACLAIRVLGGVRELMLPRISLGLKVAALAFVEDPSLTAVSFRSVRDDAMDTRPPPGPIS